VEQCYTRATCCGQHSCVALHWTLVTLIAPTHPINLRLAARAEYLNNLLYFIRDGIQANDGCEYVIVVNQVRCRLRRHQQLALRQQNPSQLALCWHWTCTVCILSL